MAACDGGINGRDDLQTGGGCVGVAMARQGGDHNRMRFSGSTTASDFAATHSRHRWRRPPVVGHIYGALIPAPLRLLGSGIGGRRDRWERRSPCRHVFLYVPDDVRVEQAIQLDVELLGSREQSLVGPLL
jgi:hypothetical protein